MLLWIFAVVLILAGLAGIVLPAMPGKVLIFAGLLLAAWIGFSIGVGVKVGVAFLMIGIFLAASFVF